MAVSVLHAHYRDVEPVVAAVLLPWFFVTPIFLRVDDLPGVSSRAVARRPARVGQPGRALRERGARAAVRRGGAVARPLRLPRGGRARRAGAGLAAASGGWAASWRWCCEAGRGRPRAAPAARSCCTPRSAARTLKELFVRRGRRDGPRVARPGRRDAARRARRGGGPGGPQRRRQDLDAALPGRDRAAGLRAGGVRRPRGVPARARRRLRGRLQRARERLPQRRAARLRARGDRGAAGGHRRVLGAGRVHRRAGARPTARACTCGWASRSPPSSTSTCC